MLTKLFAFVTLTALSGFGLVMSVAGNGAQLKASGGCCSSNACGLCEDCTCSCVDGCRCCDGEPCLCGDACSCKCCDLSATSSVAASEKAGRSSCCTRGEKCSVDLAAAVSQTSGSIASAKLANPCCSDNACGKCETCTCQCVEGCSCCTGDACLCGSACECTCCETGAAG